MEPLTMSALARWLFHSGGKFLRLLSALAAFGHAPLAWAYPAPTFADVPFATVSGGMVLNLDLYIPSNACGRMPVVIYLHGGGWLSGDKLDAGPHVSKFLDRGLAVASIDYRLSYQAHFPAQIHDCKGAVRFLRAHAA